MATVTSIYPGTAASGTFSAVDSQKAVFTTTTLTNGATLTTTEPWASWVDKSTATTIRVPLTCLASVA